MFKRPTRIYAHTSAVKNNYFVTPEFILHRDQDEPKLMRRFCPHRMYPIGEVGEKISSPSVTCKFHGFSWDSNGLPINNDRNLLCRKIEIGRSGLIFENFQEPDAKWVNDLEKETQLEYSHTLQGESNGSWLWMMEIQADLLHIWKEGIHPGLSSVTDLNEIDMYNGEEWILQTCSTGWWLFVYPFTFVEWSPGCLSVNFTIPNDMSTEFGFKWVTQFYYDPSVDQKKRKEFETLEDVFHEDVEAIEKQKGPWFPLLKSQNRLEDHCVHFGKWVLENRSTK
jgi:hypothetical protein